MPELRNDEIIDAKQARVERLQTINADLLAALRPLVAIVNGARVPKIKKEQYLDTARAAIAKAREG